MSPYSTWRRARVALIAALLAVCCTQLTLTGAVQVQQAKAAGAQKAPSRATQADDTPGIWAKICSESPDPRTPDKKIKRCATQFEAFNRQGISILAVAVAPVEGKEQDVLSIVARHTPMGLALLRGVQGEVDGKATINLRFTFCFVDSCIAETAATDEVMKLLRNGKSMRVVLTSATGKLLSLPVPLESFAKVYDGPSVDAKKYAEGRRRFLEAYRKAQADAQATATSATGGTQVPKGK